MKNVFSLLLFLLTTTCYGQHIFKTTPLILINNRPSLCYEVGVSSHINVGASAYPSFIFEEGDGVVTQQFYFIGADIRYYQSASQKGYYNGLSFGYSIYQERNTDKAARPTLHPSAGYQFYLEIGVVIDLGLRIQVLLPNMGDPMSVLPIPYLSVGYGF